MKKIKRLLALHIDLQTIVIFVLVASMFWRPLARNIFLGINFATIEIGVPQWFSQLILNILGGVVAAIILGTIAYVVFKINLKSEISGAYNTFVTDEYGNEEPWGKAVLLYNIFTQKYKTSVTHDGVEVKGEAMLLEGRYLTGYYSEKKAVRKRRFGSFLYTRSGDGNQLKGKAICFSPENENFDKPDILDIKWVQI